MVFNTLFSYFPMIIAYFQDFEFSLQTILLTAASFILPIGIFVLLLFKADSIINLFRLDRGFDDDIIRFEKIQFDHLIIFACVILGGLLILNNIVYFIEAVLNSFADLVRPKYPISNDLLRVNDHFYPPWLFSGINLLMGYLVIDYRYKIAKYLLKSRADQYPIESIDQSDNH